MAMKPRYLKDLAYEACLGFNTADREPLLVMAASDDHPACEGPVFLAERWPAIRDGLRLTETNRSEGHVEHQDICGPDVRSTVTYVQCSVLWHDLCHALRTTELPEKILRRIQVLGGEYLTLDRLRRFVVAGGKLPHVYSVGIDKYLRRQGGA